MCVSVHYQTHDLANHVSIHGGKVLIKTLEIKYLHAFLILTTFIVITAVFIDHTGLMKAMH